MQKERPPSVGSPLELWGDPYGTLVQPALLHTGQFPGWCVLAFSHRRLNPAPFVSGLAGELCACCQTWEVSVFLDRLSRISMAAVRVAGSLDLENVSSCESERLSRP
jgi:hypothetical protein